jgi:hypothetical protein
MSRSKTLQVRVSPEVEKIVLDALKLRALRGLSVSSWGAILFEDAARETLKRKPRR